MATGEALHDPGDWFGTPLVEAAFRRGSGVFAFCGSVACGHVP